MDLIIHHIDKIKHSKNSKLKKTDKKVELAKGIDEQGLFSQLTKLFESGGMMYGNFAESSRFEANLLKYSNELSKSLDLMRFSHISVASLQKIMDGTSASTGGFIWYLSYLKDNDLFVMVLVLNNKDEFTLQLINDAYVINSTEYLDLTKLRMGFTVNVSAYYRDEDKYIRFKSKGRSEASEYFYDRYVETKDIYSIKKTTDLLLNWVEKEIDKVAKDGNVNRFEIKTLVDGYFERNEKVSLVGLSEVLYPGDDEKKLQFMEKASHEKIPEIVELHKDTVKKYRLVRFKKKNSNIDLRFTSSDVEEKLVIINQTSKTILIPNVDEDLLRKFK